MFVRSRLKSGMRVLFPLALVFLSGFISVDGKTSVDSEIFPYTQKDGSWDLVRVDDLTVTTVEDVTDGVYLLREANAVCSGQRTFD